MILLWVSWGITLGIQTIKVVKLIFPCPSFRIRSSNLLSLVFLFFLYPNQRETQYFGELSARIRPEASWAPCRSLVKTLPLSFVICFPFMCNSLLETRVEWQTRGEFLLLQITWQKSTSSHTAWTCLSHFCRGSAYAFLWHHSTLVSNQQKYSNHSFSIVSLRTQFQLQFFIYHMHNHCRGVDVGNGNLKYQAPSNNAN